MAASLICVYQGHDECELANCTCTCHATLKHDLLKAVDDLIGQVAVVFPDQNDLTAPPVEKALRFVRQAVQFYCTVPLCAEDARRLVSAESILAAHIGLNPIDPCEFSGTYRVEVLVDGAWTGNDITYPDRDSAQDAATSLKRRWTAVQDVRITEIEYDNH